MLPLALLPASVVVSIDGVVLDDSSVTLLLRTASATSRCPLCDRPSHHVHSRYARTVADLPSLGKRPVRLLSARKFFCDNGDCPREVFCERLPDLAPAYARSSSRLTDAHRAIAFALGGEAGCRLAAKLSMPTSADTLLRRIGQVAMTPAHTPRVLGVDDWAIRKGLTYGTILVDLERGAVIDLLPGRDSATLRGWLQEHSGVEIISRDRATAYAQAASEAAPDAMQVADRWHLLKNVREMLERFFERHRGEIRAVSSALARPPTGQGPAADPPRPEEPAPEQGERPGPPPVPQFAVEADDDVAPEQGEPPGPPSVTEPATGERATRAKRKAEEQARLETLRGIGEEFREVLALAEEFIALIRKERVEPLADWLGRAEKSTSAEVRGFAQGVRQDEAAVSAAMTEEWSNGPVEGAVNRLKTIKRVMYGRAGFDLLRRRVLHTD